MTSVPLLRSDLLTQAGFVHGFTTRAGGVSVAPYDSFDFATNRDPGALRENLHRLAGTLGIQASRLHQAFQVHGSRRVVVDDDPARTLALEADVLIAEPGSGNSVAVRVADCVPVLLADLSTGRVAAVHAGWRGIEAGAVNAALTWLVKDQRPRQLIAAIGPCIGPCCFEVGVDVADRIEKAAEAWVDVRRVYPKAFVDLRRAVRAQLETFKEMMGVDTAIEDVGGCTRCDAEHFYSYRRDGDASGRLLGVIAAR
jgi:YfiH family protein